MQFEKLILPLVRQTPQKMTKSLDANLKGMGHRSHPFDDKPHKRIRMYFRKYSVLSGKTGQRYLGIVNLYLTPFSPYNSAENKSRINITS